jgi:hypothetical protein
MLSFFTPSTSSNKDFHLISNTSCNADDKSQVPLEIKQYIQNTHKAIQKEKSEERSWSLINAIKSNDINTLSELFEKYQLDREFLALIDSNLLFNVIIEARNSTIYEFTKLINRRYRMSNIGEFLADELLTLQVLTDQLESYIGSSKLGQPRALILHELFVTIVTQYERLENNRNNGNLS